MDDERRETDARQQHIPRAILRAAHRSPHLLAEARARREIEARLWAALRDPGGDPVSDVAGRMRALADAPWRDRGDAATQAALREGAGEIERLHAAARAAAWALSQAEATAAVLRGRVEASQAAHDSLCDALVAVSRGEAPGAIDGCVIAADALRAIAARSAAPSGELNFGHDGVEESP